MVKETTSLDIEDEINKYHVEKKRQLFITSDVDEWMVDDFRKKMLYLETKSKNPIMVVIDSYGGDEYGMFAMYDIIRNSNCKVITCCNGKAMSAASLLLAAGDDRIMTSNSVVMIHEGWESLEHYSNRLISEAEEVKRLEDLYKKLMQKHTKLDNVFFKKMVGKNIYLTPEQCKKLNIIDNILGE